MNATLQGDFFDAQAVKASAALSTAGAAAGPAVWLDALARHGLLRWQHGNTNIGLLLSCLLDVTGWQGDVLSLTDALPGTTHVIALPDVLAVMGALGYRIHQERINARQIKAEDMPGLFIPTHASGWHAGLVVRESGPYGVIWEDGRERHRGTLPDKNGTLYRFERVTMETRQEDTGAPVRSWLAEMRERFSPLLRHAFLLSLLMHLFTLAMPLFSMAVYDRVIGAHAPETLPLLATGVLLALSLEGVIRWMRIRLAGWIGARAGVLATAAMFERLLFLPASVIEQASVSAQLARIRAFESVRDFIASPTFLTILEIPFIFVLIGVIALLAGPVAWVSVMIVAAQLTLMLLMRTRWQRLSQETAHAAAARQHILMDAIEHLKGLYGAGLSARMLQRFKQISWQAAKAHYRFGLNASIVQHLAGFFTIIAGVATINWGLERIWAGQMTGGAMVATMIITWRVLYPLQALCATLPHIEQIRGSLKQVTQLMNFTPEAHAARAVLAEYRLKGKISIQNLGLRYGRKSDPVFLGLSAEIAAGQIIAIYGGNGSGKSSVLRVLLGLYAPAMGSIRLDGVDHRQFDPRSLRRQIAYLPQTPELIPGTIADNLRIHDPLAAEYRLRQALLWSDAWEHVEKLPAGVDTRIGEGGLIPSSGFAARIALARLYLAERPLVLCDELPGQLLNSVTAEHFRRYIEDCRGKRTVLFVTHRDDWLPLADQVIWLKPDTRPVVGRPTVSNASLQGA
jgi:ABC-type bacteriocin/lantibiotic exporter with double-glycine peptidase domain